MVSRRPEPLRRPVSTLPVVSASKITVALPPERTAREKGRVVAESVISSPHQVKAR